MSKYWLQAVGGVLTIAAMVGLRPIFADSLPDANSPKVIQLVKSTDQDKIPVISGVALDPSGKLLATVGDDHLLRVWNLASGQVLFQLGPHADWVRAVAFRADGKIFATAGDDRRIRYW